MHSLSSDSTPPMTHSAVLGTGLLGTGFVEGLLTRGGASVTAWNRTRSKADPLAALGARVVETPAEAVRGASLVHLVLLDDEVVDTTIDAFRASLESDAIVVDHTTTLPARTARRAKRLADAGIAFLHAPVMMGPGAARAAKGMMLVAGPTTLVDRARPSLEAMTGELWHVGERSDLAAVYKLFGNAAVLSIVGVVADIMHMADSATVPRRAVLEMLAKVNLGGSISMRGEMMATGKFDTNFTLDVARKDLRLMLETLGETPAPLLRALASAMDTGIAAGDGEIDFAVLGR